MSRKKRIRIESGPAKDEHVSDSFLLATLEFTAARMTVSVGADGGPEGRLVCRIWEHTVYELENLACALRLAAEGGVPKSFRVPSPDVLIGPHVDLWPAVTVEVGHPGIGRRGRGATFHCCAKASPFAKRRLVFLDAICDRRAEQMVLEAEDALKLAAEVYRQAKALAPRFVIDGSG
jgi:hypothetical protein